VLQTGEVRQREKAIWGRQVKHGSASDVHTLRIFPGALSDANAPRNVWKAPPTIQYGDDEMPAKRSADVQQVFYSIFVPFCKL
jgi:hypothetical protein